MVVRGFVHNHQRTFITGHSTHIHRISIVICIKLIHSIIIKSTIRTTELSVHRTITGRTVPRAGVPRYPRTTIARTSTDRHISCCTEA